MTDERKNNRKLLAFFIVFFVVIAFLAIYGAEHYNAHDESIELETYCKVSDSALIKDNTSTFVYYITWGGSPTGDAGSWALYDFLHSNGFNMNGTFNETQSMSGYQYNNTPGLIFNTSYTYSVTYDHRNTIVVPVYLYGENLNNNTTPAAGLKVLKADVPSSVYNVVKGYTTEAIVGGLSISSDNMSSIPHINSVTLITGPSGAYLFNGYIVDPADYTNDTPGEVLHDVNNNTNDNGINTGMEGLEATIKDVR
ncbi:MULTISPECIES: DUF929 family protein [Ferroplasma]|jgi:hypothetical protein|uniref:Uncharacterized protein n=1 Tax=Ferroplasma acidarmanus Fer1 TaxID=333146 RepID=S0AQ85_FERAC|nr:MULTISPECIES: DUF929 family protein [Ferroplasma]AGO61106.1 hypothetical protein FACI_IFERC00001G1126 [Ferroplasma acidarmanus Fer1]MCL4348734.1 DUF929 domain-containing protein [Candidatus Thermoplasmatota archaeon]WMT52981.1 MAG: DUF929 family protein [Ferroplasma acidiphilum]